MGNIHPFPATKIGGRFLFNIAVLTLFLSFQPGNPANGKPTDIKANKGTVIKPQHLPKSRFQLPESDINQFIMYGQSLSTGQQTQPAISVNNYKGNLMLGEQVWSNYSNKLDTSNLIFTPLTAKPVKTSGKTNDEILADVTIDAIKQICCEPPVIGFTNCVKYYSDQLYPGLAERKFAATSCGEGGKTIELLSKGCPNQKGRLYDHYLKMIAKSNEAAKRMNKSLNCSAILWMQGEYNYTRYINQGWENNTRGTGDKQEYKKYFTKLIDDMTDDVKAVYHQTNDPLFITYQCGAQYTSSYDVSIGMAQLETANSDPRAVMAAPVYPVSDRGGHLCPNGSRWFGEMMAKAYIKTVLKGEKWKPLQPERISKGKNFIDIDFYVPEPPLRMDTLTLEKAANYGFEVRENGQLKKINSVKLLSAKKIRLMVKDDFSQGKVEITYGGASTKGNGNLCDSDAFQSFEIYQELIAKGQTEAEKNRFKPKYEPRDQNGKTIYNQHYPMQNFCCVFYYSIPDKIKFVKCL